MYFSHIQLLAHKLNYKDKKNEAPTYCNIIETDYTVQSTNRYKKLHSCLLLRAAILFFD